MLLAYDLPLTEQEKIASEFSYTKILQEQYIGQYRNNKTIDKNRCNKEWYSIISKLSHDTVNEQIVNIYLLSNYIERNQYTGLRTISDT